MVERRDAVAPLACGFDSRHSRFSGVLGIARGQGAAALLKTLINITQQPNMDEIMIALFALLVGAAIGGVMPWVAYRLGKRSGYADGVARSSFGSSPDPFFSLLPLILLAMPKGGLFGDYSQKKESAE